MTFGQKVKTLRKNLGITQEQLAERVGRGKSYICNIERGTRTTKIENLPALADALEVPISELMGEDIDPSNPFLEFLPYLAQASEETIRNIRFMLGMPQDEKKSVCASSHTEEQYDAGMSERYGST